MKKLLFTALVALLFAACGGEKKPATEDFAEETHILHAEQIAALTPDAVIADLKAGNERFVAHCELHRNGIAQLKESATDGQHPEAIVLSCIDSRVPVELLFDKGVGDIFVTRIAGNVAGGDVLGSMEYACGHSGSKLVVVLGHENCGAVHSAVAGAKGGNMTEMLAKIQPAIDACRAEGLEGSELENAVVERNVRNMVEVVRAGSDELRELEQAGTIRIVGAVFDLHTGKVTFLE